MKHVIMIFMIKQGFFLKQPVARSYWGQH